jgi:hypothetical protein
MPRRRLALLLVAAAASTGASLHAASQHRAPSPVDGVWEYANPDMRGQAFLIDGRYAYFNTPTDGAASADSTRKYDIDAGTYSVSDSIVTSKREYGNNGRHIGETWRWSYSMKGDTCTYHVLNAEGKAVSTGRAVRIRKVR